MSRVSLIVVAILFLLVGSLVWWFFATHERYEKVIQLGYAGEAATNNFYAAELFLEKFNITHTAKSLGISIQTLQSQIRYMGLKNIIKESIYLSKKLKTLFLPSMKVSRL